MIASLSIVAIRRRSGISPRDSRSARSRSASSLLPDTPQARMVGVVAARQRVAVEAVAVDRGFDAADDRRRGLAAELLVEDRARQRIDRIERLAPARIGLDRAELLHPCAELAVALAEVGEGGIGVESAGVARHVQPRRALSVAAIDRV